MKWFEKLSKAAEGARVCVCVCVCVCVRARMFLDSGCVCSSRPNVLGPWMKTILDLTCCCTFVL